MFFTIILYFIIKIVIKVFYMKKINYSKHYVKLLIFKVKGTLYLYYWIIPCCDGFETFKNKKNKKALNEEDLKLSFNFSNLVD